MEIDFVGGRMKLFVLSYGGVGANERILMRA